MSARRKPTGISRRWLIVAAVVGAIALAGALVALSRTTTDEEPPTPAQLGGTSEVTELLAGVPQQGIAIGEPDAPVTLVEYADLQCPFCAEWTIRAFPTIVADYVRTGKVRVEFRGLAFIGPDSEKALRAALAAGEQDKLWHVVELLYWNHQAENSGWVTDELLRQIGNSVPGLDVDQMLADADSEAVSAAITRAADQAAEHDVTGTPTLFAGRTGQQLRRVELSSLDASGTTPALDELLRE